jgi:hypothetical protein
MKVISVRQCVFAGDVAKALAATDRHSKVLLALL